VSSYNLAVRLLLLSDIHSNLEALEACLDAAPEYDFVANLGDVVGYGGSPNQVVDLVRAMDPVSVRGNHDCSCCGLTDLSTFNPVAAAAAMWTRSELSEKNLNWLRELPAGPLRGLPLDGMLWDVQLVHGSPEHENTYIASELSAGAALAESTFHLTFFGHTHIQGAYALRQKRTEAVPLEPVSSENRILESRLALDPKLKYLVNPGSVGQPRDHDRRAAFAVYDEQRREVLFYRVAYDIAHAQERILSAGLPQALAARLEEGR
jgi:predicted phosphodiesterase